MTIYAHFIPPLVPAAGGAGVSAITLLMPERLRNKQKARPTAALDDWENEGGSMAATHVAATRVVTPVGDVTVIQQIQFDNEAAATGNRYGQRRQGPAVVMKTPSSAYRDRPDNAGYSSHRHACPCCNGSVDRVPRRFVDLLLSRFMPVHRYRCDSMGCGWEGNLRVKRYSLLIRR